MYGLNYVLEYIIMQLGSNSFYTHTPQEKSHPQMFDLLALLFI